MQTQGVWKKNEALSVQSQEWSIVLLLLWWWKVGESLGSQTVWCRCGYNVTLDPVMVHHVQQRQSPTGIVTQQLNKHTHTTHISRLALCSQTSNGNVPFNTLSVILETIFPANQSTGATTLVFTTAWIVLAYQIYLQPGYNIKQSKPYCHTVEMHTSVIKAFGLVMTLTFDPQP